MSQAHLAGLGYPATAHQARVGCGAVRGAEPAPDCPTIRGLLFSIPETLCTFEVSSASSKLKGGRIPEMRWASMVLPDPGGPIGPAYNSPMVRLQSNYWRVLELLGADSIEALQMLRRQMDR